MNSDLLSRSGSTARQRARKKRAAAIRSNYDLYLFLIPAAAFLIVFKYWPMYGVQIAFKEYFAREGILGSPWVGFENFARFFNTYLFWTVIRNTVGISLYQLIAGFPAPIILALLLNHVRRRRFKKSVQLVTYAPHFISTVVAVGMVMIFLSPRGGVVNSVLRLAGGDTVMFMARPEWFKTIYVVSEIWQHTGWGTIIYLAALSSVSPEYHEAAIIDGATVLQRIRHIDLPGIVPTAIILLILRTGRIMEVGFEKVFLMQNSLNLPSSEIIATYVYKVGLIRAEYGYSAAVGLFNSAISLVLIILVNRLARSFSETSLW